MPLTTNEGAVATLRDIIAPFVDEGFRNPAFLSHFLDAKLTRLDFLAYKSFEARRPDATASWMQLDRKAIVVPNLWKVIHA
ncbi:hypothetical protein [Thioclava sp. GXIMD4215]|uniref:hypothetical protein n=1 Tax=Thioclava sp. GXIMD4215 TaxID=3131928 RepID=UPI00311AF81A